MLPAISSVLSAALLDRQGNFRGQVRALHADKLSFDRLPKDRIAAAVSRDLAALLSHARRSVPRFRGLLAGQAAIHEQNALSILQSLPVMRKSDVQTDLMSFVSESSRDSMENSTGGSTGMPMVFRIDQGRKLSGEASHWWSNGLAGWIPGDRVAMLWGAPGDTGNATARRRMRVRNWIENIRWYDAFDMGPEKMRGFREDMRRFAPHLIVGYAGSLYEFARFLEDEGGAVGFPTKSIVSSAEMLSPAMRKVVERVFGKPVFDRYGSREFGPVAAECEAHAGLHVNEMDCLVEIDSVDPYRVPGPILVTYFRNFAMPFIRYDTGDIGRFESADPCACGRTTLRLAPVVGRESDTFRTADGKLVHGEYFTHVLYGTNAVREFRFVQESLTHYRLLLVADRSQTQALEPGWKDQILKMLGSDAELTLEYVDSIPALPSGKRKFTISLINQKNT